MGHLEHVPGSTEGRLAELLEEADAFAAHLDATPEHAVHLLVQRSRVLRASADELTATVEGLVELPASAKADVRAAAEALATALDLATAAGSAARQLGKRKARIAEACVELEGEVVAAFARSRQRFGVAATRALRCHHRARQMLDLEMRIADARRRLTSGCRGRALERRRAELGARVAAVRSQLEDKRRDLAEQRSLSARHWRELDAALRGSVEEIGAALEGLLR